MIGVVEQRGGISNPKSQTISTGGGGIVHRVGGACDQEQTAVAIFTTKVVIMPPTGVVLVDGQPSSIVVHFDRKMQHSPELIDPANYIVAATSGAAIGVTVLSVEPENIINPQIVTLITTEMTSFNIYELSALLGPIGYVDHAPIDVSATPINLFPSGGSPEVESLVATSRNSWVVTFSEGMLNNAAINSADHYEFTSPVLQVHSAQYISATKVLLITDDQEPGVLYTLTIHGNGPP